MITYGKAKAEHAIGLAELHAECFSKPWPSKDFTRWAEEKNAHVVSAIDNTLIVGGLAATVVEGEAEVLTLMVRPGCRRAGIARQLLQCLFSEIASDRQTRITLEVDEANRVALALYRGEGFSVIGRRKAYYRRGDGSSGDALVLERTIPERVR